MLKINVKKESNLGSWFEMLLCFLRFCELVWLWIVPKISKLCKNGRWKCLTISRTFWKFGNNDPKKEQKKKSPQYENLNCCLLLNEIYEKQLLWILYQTQIIYIHEYESIWYQYLNVANDNQMGEGGSII